MYQQSYISIIPPWVEISGVDYRNADLSRVGNASFFFYILLQIFYFTLQLSCAFFRLHNQSLGLTKWFIVILIVFIMYYLLCIYLIVFSMLNLILHSPLICRYTTNISFLFWRVISNMLGILCSIFTSVSFNKNLTQLYNMLLGSNICYDKTLY